MRGKLCNLLCICKWFSNRNRKNLLKRTVDVKWEIFSTFALTLNLRVFAFYVNVLPIMVTFTVHSVLFQNS